MLFRSYKQISVRVIPEEICLYASTENCALGSEVLFWDRAVFVYPIKIIIKVTIIADFIFCLSLTVELTGRRGSFSSIPWSDSLNGFYRLITVAIGLTIKHVSHRIPIINILAAIELA